MLAVQALAPPRWGGNTSTLAWQAVVYEWNPADAPSHPRWTFNYYYDWSIPASRYEHSAGVSELCVQSGALPNSSCTILNARDGRLYMIFPATPASCCRCESQRDSFVIKSEWLHSNATYLGRSIVAGRLTDGWLKWGAFDNHYFATADAIQAPVRFEEHKHGQARY